MDLTGVPAYHTVMKELLPTLNISTEIPRLIDDIVKAGKRIGKFREEKGMDLEQLGRLSGLVPSYIASIEIGEADPYMTEIYDITKALGIQLSDLFE